jgi:hypothetical protein
MQTDHRDRSHNVQGLLLAWVETLRAKEPAIIAVDGKTSRRGHARGKGRLPLHIVSAWATNQRLVLGQKAVAERSNEITAISALLRRLERAGAIDAMGPRRHRANHSRRRQRLCPDAQGELARLPRRGGSNLC